MITDAKVDRDLYVAIVTKFYAAMRFNIYQKLKKYWKENLRDCEDDELPIPDEKIVEMAETVPVV